MNDNYQSLVDLLVKNYNDLPLPVKNGLDSLNDYSMPFRLDALDLINLVGGTKNYKGLSPSHKLESRLTSVDRIKREAVFFTEERCQVSETFSSLSLLTKSGETIKLW